MRQALTSPLLTSAVLAAAMVLGTLIAPSPASAQNSDQLAEYMARTGEIVAMAGDLVRETESPLARRVHDEALRLHTQSMHMGQGGQNRQAFNFSRRARTAAQYAARLAREARGQQERAQLRLERYTDFRDQILDRAREAENERALRFIRESEQQAARARDHYRQGDFDLSLSLLDPAEAMLTRAARLLFEGGGGRLERELERTRAYLDRMTESVSTEAAGDLLESARASFARAEEFQKLGQPLRALHALRLARNLAGQAASTAGDDIDTGAVQQQLERWDARFEAVAEQVRESGARSAVDALDRARHHRDRAGRRLDDGEPEQALRQIKAAFDLLNEASELAQ